MFFRIIHLMIKEFLTALRDPKARMMLIVPPIIQLCIFSFAITQEVKNVTLAILNQDIGVEGSSLIKRFEKTSITFSRVIYLHHVSEIDRVIDNQEAIAVLVVPQDFSERFLSEKQNAEVQVLLDGRKANAAPIVGGYMQKIIASFVQQHEFGSRQPPGINVVTRNWFNVNLDPRKALIPCLICILGTVIGLILSAMTVAREREMGTFEQILVSPLGPFEILIGKALPSLALATCSSVLVTLIVIFGFGIPIKSDLWLLIFSLESFLLSIIGIGLFISSLSMTQQQAILGAFIVMPPLTMLSGFATPVENMPEWFQTITIVNPLRWMLVIIKGIFLKGMSPQTILQNTMPILLIAFCTLSAAVFMFKRRME